jgi:Tol biopolymer transport system component
MTYDSDLGDYRTALYVMRADGREKRVIRGVHPSGSNGLPTRPSVIWSRDGRRIFFIGNGGLSVINADGTERRSLIPQRLSPDSFALSPDQRRIAVAATDGRKREIYSQEIFVLNADGSGLRNVTNRRGREFDPQWSPDGRRIAFSRATRWAADVEIFVMNADGTDEANISQHPSDDDLAPAWRPFRRRTS